jgi:hypothetical protein
MTGDLFHIISQMKQSGIEFESGLTDSEIQQAEQWGQFRFVLDLREFLQTALPVAWNTRRGRREFPRWRHDPHIIKNAQVWIWEGIEFDILHNHFWLEEWGEKPVETDDALSVARQHVSAAPLMIPIYAHRHIPAEPHETGNPVFSIYQTDIIYYGLDLEGYLQNEFLRGSNFTIEDSSAKRIRFWSRLVDINNAET